MTPNKLMFAPEILKNDVKIDVLRDSLDNDEDFERI